MNKKPILFSTPMVQAILEGRKTQTRRIIKPQPWECSQYGGAGYAWDKKGPESASYKWNTNMASLGNHMIEECPYGGTEDKEWQTGLPPESGMYIVKGWDKPIWLDPVPAGTYPDIDHAFITWGWNESDDPEDTSMDGGPTAETIQWKRPGTILWVRESWRKYYPIDENGYAGFDNPVIEYAADNPDPIYLKDGDGFQIYDKKGNEKMVPWKPSIHMPYSACRLFLRMTDIRVERLQDITEMDAFAEGIDDQGDAYWEAEDAQLAGVTVQAGSPAQHAFACLWDRVNGPGAWSRNEWVWVVSFERTEKPE